ncbi:MAG: sensor histidine kinase [Planctomycetota bacterium]
MRFERVESEDSGAEHNRTVVRSYQTVGLLHLFASFFLTIFLVSISPGQPQARQTRNILILNSYHRGLKWTDDEVRGAKAVLLRAIKDVEIYIEYMDTKRILREEYLQLFRKMLQLKYDKVELDAIIATDDNALRFLFEYQEELFDQVPVVFCGVNDFEESMLDGRGNFTGLTEALEFKTTIDLALKLHPGTSKIVVISDHTTTGIGQRKDIMALEGQYEEMKFEYLNGEDLSTEELIEKLAGPGGDSIAFLTTWIWDKTGRYVPVSDLSMSKILARSSAPVYGFTDMWLYSGIVGGKLLNGRCHGQEAAELVLRILDGEKPADIPVRTENISPYMFDYTELKRRQINMSDLPQGSIIINEPETLYYQHKTGFWIVAGIITGLTGMSIILFANIFRRRRVEKALRASEQRYTLAHRIGKMAAWESDLRTGELYWTKECYAQYGFAPGQFKGTRQAFYDECVHPDDLQYVLDSVKACIEKGKEYNVEYRFIHADGNIRWVSTTADVIRDENGKPIRLAGISQDVTSRKQAEEALAYSESIYRKAIENAHGVPYELRYSDGKYIFMGSGIEELLGVAAEEMSLEKTLEILKDITVISPAGYKDFEEARRAFREGKTDHLQLDARIRTPDGQTKWVNISNLPAKDSDTGEVSGSIGIIQDITKRKQTEEKLKKVRDDYLMISNLIGDIVVTIDKEGRWTFLNDEACRFWGKAKEELLGVNFVDYLHSEDVEKTTTHIELIKKKETVKGLINRQKTPEGWRMIEWNATGIFDKAGNYTGIQATGRDITEQKYAEEALARSESIYRGAIENAQGVPYQVRFSDGKYLFMGSGAEELLGVSPEKLTREKFCEMVEEVTITDLSGPEGMEAYKRSFEDGEIERYQADLHFRTPNGQMKWFSDCSVPIREEKTGKVVGALGILQDISKRKKVEDSVRESEEKFRTIFDNATDGIILVEPKSKRLYTGNKMICKMLGYSLKEISNLRVSDIHPRKDLAYVLEQFNAQLNKKFSLAKNIPMKRKDGSIFYADINSSTIKVAGKIYLMGVFRDITDRKEAEKKLFEHQQQLKSLSSELLLAEERERRSIAIELHDRISQSLVIAKIKLDSLGEFVTSKDSGKVLKEVCDSLRQTIQDTRSLTFDLSCPILYELGFEMAVSEWLTEQIEKKNGIATKFRDDGKNKPLDNDISVLLFRTVRELLINVIKHAKAKHVTVSTRKVDNEIEVSVEDDGVGFKPPEVLSIPARIGRFGLFSIRERLEYLGGRIEIESGAGEGCKITVAAPLSVRKNKRAKK